MLDANQFRELVIRPTLKSIGLWSPEAEELLLGTAAHESLLGTYLRQVRGPALGVYQMEPATYRDIWENYLRYKPHLVERLNKLVPAYDGPMPPEEQLITNLAYATAMTRIFYLRVPKALPEEGDLDGQAHYWKRYYNTHLGRGRVEEYVRNFPGA